MTSKKSWALMLSTCAGVGNIPKAPGTFGSLLALPLCWGLYQCNQVWGGTDETLLVGSFLMLGMLTILSWWSIRASESVLGQHDHPSVVIDEVLGQAIVLIPFVPHLGNYVAGFVLFRIFDIFKPGPIGWIDQRMHGAWGTILDDVLAGVAALFCLAFFRWAVFA